VPTRRAGCIERCSPSSTEARRSNPSVLKLWLSRCMGGREQRTARVIPTFYPMAETPKRGNVHVSALGNPRAGATGKCFVFGLSRLKRGGDGSKRVSGHCPQIPSEGFGPDPITGGSFNSARVGSLRPGDRRSRLFDRSRGPGANPSAVNSSTTKGPEGLASNSDWRRCRTAKTSHRWVRGCFYVLPPEICPVNSRAGNCVRAGARSTR
jgi:hypothetical protein